MQRARTFLIILLISILSAMYLQGYMYARSQSSVSAVVTANYIGVYWDHGCLGRAYSVDWGTLHLGESTEKVVYVQNEGNEPFYLNVRTASWNSSDASSALKFSWDPRGIRIQTNEVATITLNLHVSSSVYRTISFAFTIIFSGSKYLLGDLNRDDAVDTKDYILFKGTLLSSAGAPNWNPDADLNEDGVLDVRDYQIIRNLIPTLPRRVS